MTKRIAGPRLPIIVTEIAYSEAAIWANRLGVSLRDYTEAALDAANRKAERNYRDGLYAQACRDAEAARTITPTRHEWDREQQPFVRRQRSASENQAGRPSSRHDPKATARRAGQHREAGPEPRAARQREHGEDPHVDQPEHRGTSQDMPPEDRWGPLSGEVTQPPGKYTRTL